MQKKTFFILIGLFVIAGIVWGAITFWQAREQSLTGGSVLEKSRTASVDRITISQNTTTITLSRSDGSWHVGEFTADSQKVSDALGRLAGISFSDPVSRNVQNYSRFGVDDAAGIKVVVAAGGQEATSLMIGNSLLDGGTYFRIGQEPTVFQAKEDLRALFPVSVSAWREKTVFSATEEESRKIVLTLQSGKTKTDTLTFSRTDDTVWHIEDGSGNATSSDPLLMNRFFAGMRPLTADGFVEKTEDIQQFQKAQKVRLVLSNESGTVADASFLERPESGVWWAQVKGNEAVFEISSYRLADILLTHEMVFGK